MGHGTMRKNVETENPKKMRQNFLTRSSRAIERQNNIEAMILSSGVKENTLAVGAGAMAGVVVAVLNAPRRHTFHLVSIKIDGGGWFLEIISCLGA